MVEAEGKRGKLNSCVSYIIYKLQGAQEKTLNSIDVRYIRNIFYGTEAYNI
jgi:hypothetical protein